MIDRTYLLHDSSLIVRSDVRGRDNIVAHDLPTFKELRSVFHRAGYICLQDKKVAKCIRRGYYAGMKDDVHFVLGADPTGFKVEFYEDVIRDNMWGGRYHFDKMAKMPYLRRLKVQLIIGKLIAKLDVLGFADRTPVKSENDAWAFVLQERADLIAFQGQRMYEEPRAYYNERDADGIDLKDGDIRYFRTWKGSLCRGEVWHHINNMWWVICGRRQVHNVAAFDLFTYDSSKHQRREPVRVLDRLKRKLKKLVDSEEFEKAIGLRDAIRKLEPAEKMAGV